MIADYIYRLVYVVYTIRYNYAVKWTHIQMLRQRKDVHTIQIGKIGDVKSGRTCAENMKYNVQLKQFPTYTQSNLVSFSYFTNSLLLIFVDW